MANIEQVKKELIDASKKLFESGMLFRGNHANLSVRLDDQKIVMTKGGDVANLTEDSFVVINLDGTVHDGDITSTNAEVINMHTGVYNSRKDIGSVVHTHAPCCRTSRDSPCI